MGTDRCKWDQAGLSGIATNRLGASALELSIWARPCHICSETGPSRGWAHPCDICTRTGLTPATSAPGPGSPLPHLRRDRAHLCHICTGTGPTPAHICTGTGPTPAHTCTGTGPTPATSAPGLGPPPPTSAPRLGWGSQTGGAPAGCLLRATLPQPRCPFGAFGAPVPFGRPSTQSPFRLPSTPIAVGAADCAQGRRCRLAPRVLARRAFVRAARARLSLGALIAPARHMSGPRQAGPAAGYRVRMSMMDCLPGGRAAGAQCGRRAPCVGQHA